MSTIFLDFDPAKRALSLEHRGLDFNDCAQVFEGPHLQIEDDRSDYGEQRLIVFGWFESRRVVIVWTPRHNRRRIISMRHAHAEEFANFADVLD